MSVDVPLWLLAAAIPIVILVLTGKRCDGHSSMFGSEKDWHYFFFGPIALLCSVIAVLICFLGDAHGWW